MKWFNPVYRRQMMFPLDKHWPGAVACVPPSPCVACARQLRLRTSGRRRCIARVFMLSLAYIVLRTVYPQGMSPGESLWSICLVWLCAFHAGDFLEYCGAPKALGMLCAGLALRLMPGVAGLPPPLEGLSDDWSRNVRAGAMALIMLRAGLGINLRTLARFGWSFIAMSTLPALSESLLCAPVAMVLFDMPFLLAWSMSAMIAAVGPATITSGCAAVKERGYAPRAPNFLMAAACFDDATCIILFNLLLHSFVGSVSGDISYVLSLLALLLSPLAGAGAACLLSVTAIWCTPARRSGILVIICAMLMYVASSYEQIGAGAIANLTLGLCTRHAWLRGWPYPLLSGEHRDDVGRAGVDMLLQAHRHLAALWHVALFPLLFGLLGASFDVGRTGPSAVSAAVYALVAIGVRCVATLGISQAMPRFTRRERIFLALSWSSKAAAQAAFATAPRKLLEQWIYAHPGELLRGAWAPETLLSWADDIQRCCIFAIFISNPIAMLCINNGAYFLLAKAGKHALRGAAFGADSDDDEDNSASTVDTSTSLPELFGTQMRAMPWGGPAIESTTAFVRPFGDAAAIAALYAQAATPAAPRPSAPQDGDGGDAPLLAPAHEGDITPAPDAVQSALPEPESSPAAGAAAAPARVVFEFADMPAAAEGGVRAALAVTSMQLAELLPGGVQVEVRHVRRATSTHANVFEDPNDDAEEAAERDAAATAPPPSAARALRRRAAGCIGLAAVSAEQQSPPEPQAQQLARAAGVLAFSSEAERARSAW